MYVRCAYFEGNVDVADRERFESIVREQIAPQMLRFPRIRNLRLLWGREPADKRYLGDPKRLTPAERTLFDALRNDRLAERVRLEQERIDFAWLEQALARLSPPQPPSRSSE